MRNRELDGLRGVAILLVLGCHFEGFSWILGGLPKFGWVGVDLFFCLSGYLITAILLGLRHRPTPYKTFYARRFLRILPPYLAVIGFLTVVAVQQHWFGKTWLTMQLLFLQAYSPEQRRSVLDTLGHLRWYSQHLPPLLSRAHALPRAAGGDYLVLKSVYGILWSLSVEEYFYVLWAPVALKLPRRAIVTVGVAICLVEIFLRWSADSNLAYFGLAYRFDALIYGAFLALLLEHWKKTGVPGWAKTAFSAFLLGSVTGLCVMAALLWPVLDRDPRYSPLFLAFGLPLLSLGVASLMGLLLLKAESAWLPARLLRLSPLRYLGKISYTMYLVHIIAATAIRHLFRQPNPENQSALQAVLATAFTIVIAQLSWTLLEQPVAAWKNKRVPSDSGPIQRGATVATDDAKAEMVA